MIQRKIVYSEVALSKRKAIKKNIKDNYGKERADRFSAHISKTLSELKSLRFNLSALNFQFAFNGCCQYCGKIHSCFFQLQNSAMTGLYSFS